MTSNRMIRNFVAILIVANYVMLARANGLESLENFVKTVKTGKADFSQVVTPPAKEGQVPRIKTSTGTFEFSRPGQFKFVYKKPFEQTIVADGQTLWLYDVDLNQVTARKQAQVLGATPAALVASAVDLKALQAEFVLANDPGSAPDKDALEWVTATPKTRDGQVQTVRIAFRAGTLAVLEILDSFGQTSRMSFNGFVANAALDANAFHFKPPTGADVILQ
jgi:outer membrane lipoprotein carrier protein